MMRFERVTSRLSNDCSCTHHTWDNNEETDACVDMCVCARARARVCVCVCVCVCVYGRERSCLSHGEVRNFIAIRKFNVTKICLFLCIAGKRKFDGGHQNQGESKRRFQSNWGNQPLAQQPLGNAYGLASVNGGSGGGGGGDIGFGGRTATLGGISSDDHDQTLGQNVVNSLMI